MANAYSYYGDFNKAIALLTGILEQDEGFLRAANSLAFAYLDAGEFDKADYYAEYYLEGDESWYGIYHALAMTEYYRGEYLRAWKHLEKAEKLGNAPSSKYFRGILSLHDKEFGLAEAAFKVYLNRTPYVDGVNFKVVDRAFAKLFLELYHTYGKKIHDKATLEKQARLASDKNDNLTAALYYLLLFRIYNDQPSYLNEASYHFELNGNMYEAVKYALIYLSLEPDSPDRDYIERFLESRVVRE